jgi:hypothetical protein
VARGHRPSLGHPRPPLGVARCTPILFPIFLNFFKVLFI